jgi:hypothetical protein
MNGEAYLITRSVAGSAISQRDIRFGASAFDPAAAD